MRGRRQNPLYARAKRDFPCSTCGAKPKDSCLTADDRIAWPPHKPRLDAARGADATNTKDRSQDG